jgi:four helix bundle protein
MAANQDVILRTRWVWPKKEARESRYWLRIVKATLLDHAEVDALAQEADELVRILATIIHKTRRSL